MVRLEGGAMGLKGRHIVGIADLARSDLELLFRCADRLGAQPRGEPHLGRGYQIATLFYEPSTRTRLSFESAMNRLGGAVLAVPDPASSSAAKGESLADTIRVVSAYADLIVLRHPAEGAARLAADVATVPVVNAGDGAHEHPTQTLCDLYTLYREFGRVEGLTVTLYGDLKYGRTVHSLAYGLATFGARIVLAPADPALAPPAYLLDRLRADFGCEPDWWHPDSGAPMPPAEALYLTRIQRERFDGDAAALRSYPKVDRAQLHRWGVGEHTLLMHPLPRAGELDPELDAEARSAYFRQAANGVPVRMATLALLLGLAEEEWGSGRFSARPGASDPAPDPPRHAAFRAAGVACPNPACIATRERDTVEPRFALAAPARLHEPREAPQPGERSLGLHCRYCEQPVRAAVADFADLAADVYGADAHLPASLAGVPPDDLLLIPAPDYAHNPGHPFSDRPDAARYVPLISTAK
jgi:aspartate carbamoyltransferase catalytic subunit